MGNRAFVVFKEEQDEEPDHGVYLHWNGGPESILAFLEVLRERGWTRMNYASARFTAVVSEFFDDAGDDGGLSLGIMCCKVNGKSPISADNGLYKVLSLEPLNVLHDDRPLTESPQPTKTGDIVAMLGKIRAARKISKNTIVQ